MKRDCPTSWIVLCAPSCAPPWDSNLRTCG